MEFRNSRINSNGNVIISGYNEAATNVELTISGNGVGSNVPELILYRNDSTVSAEENLGSINFGATDGSRILSASINAYAAEAFTSVLAGSYLTFSTTNIGSSSNTEKVRLTDTGNVGIGTTSPYSLLSISNSVSTAANTPLFTIASTTAGTATSTLLTVLASGNVGIGTTAPGYKLEVIGTGYVSSTFTTGSTLLGNGIQNATNGSVTSPAFRFSSNTNTGLINSSGALGLVANGTEILRISSAGNVGIGTTTPYSLLTLYKAGSTAANSPQLVFSASSTVSGLGDFLNNWAIGTDIADGGKFKIASSSVIGTNDRFVIDGSGNVGIGTTSPFAKLSIHANAAETKLNLFAVASSTAAATTTHFVITNDGKVGIGTTAPTAGYLLDINGSLRVNNVITTADVAIGNNSGIIFAGSSNYAQITGGNSFLTFKTAGSEKVRINSSGNVGIGTTTPYSLLTLYKAGSTAANSPQLVFSASSTVSGLGDFLNNWAIGTDIADGGKFKIASSSVIGTNDRFVIDGSGNIGIGTTSPQFKLSVESSSEGNMFQIFDTDGNCRQDPDAGGITTTCSSDIRLKTDISETASLLDYFLGIPIKDYTVIASGDRMTGVIAQELLGAGYDDLAVMGEDGYYGVKEIRSWKFVKAIQEMNLKIDKIVAVSSVAIDEQGLFSRSLDWLKDKVLAVKELIVEKITTKELCVEDVCINKSQLKELLENNQIQNEEAEAPTDTEAPADTTPPVITLVGDSVNNINVGDTYVDPDVIATDNIDGDLTTSITKGGTFVDASTAGTYTVTYNVSDAAGNTAIEAIRTVNVLEAVVPVPSE